MLQPLQIQDVHARYEEQIAELRDFLLKARMPLGTAETLGTLAHRVTTDRAFHRDLTSYIWVVIDRSNHQIVYSDLLAVLAIAAVGPRLAAAADEDTAHDLLRFLMQAHHSLDNASGLRAEPTRRASSAERPVATARTAQPERTAQHERTAQPERPAPPEHIAQPERRPQPTYADSAASEAEPARTNRRTDRRALWLVAAAALCLLIALSSAFWLRLNRKAPADTTATTESATTAPAIRPAPAVIVEATPPVHAAEPSTAPTAKDRPASKPSALGRPYAPPLPSPQIATAAAPTYTVQPDAPPAPRPSLPPATPATRTIAPPNIRTAKPNTPAFTIVPAATLSKRLGTPTYPTNYYVDSSGAAVNPNYPRLRRRQPASGAFSPDDSTLVADARAPATASTNNRAPSAGTVHSTSEGTMAANVIYSPSPAYPAAAAAAHVQGQVTLQAEVGRDGSVASARVVSGPPQLRDAALDAVQQWRYRPYYSGGKSITMRTTVIVDFELP